MNYSSCNHSILFQIEMEDPLAWSPSMSAPPKSMFSEPAKMPHMAPPIITVTEEAPDQEEESEEEEEEGVGEEGRPMSSSSEEEDDYPDTVIKAPTVSPATIVALQEEQEMERQKIVAEVFQQIQAFGEAADDEFDVQWAKPKHQQQQQPKPVEVVQKVRWPTRPRESEKSTVIGQ